MHSTAYSSKIVTALRIAQHVLYVTCLDQRPGRPQLLDQGEHVGVDPVGVAAERVGEVRDDLAERRRRQQAVPDQGGDRVQPVQGVAPGTKSTFSSSSATTCTSGCGTSTDARSLAVIGALTSSGPGSTAASRSPIVSR